jgi:hypothetical protein
MKPVRRLTPYTLAVTILSILLTGCMPKSGGDNGPEYVETYYIDTPNGFAMAYPAAWIKIRRGSSSVAWQPPTGEDGAAEVMATVTSLSPSEVPGGDERMLRDFASAHSGFVITSEEQIEGPGGTPALRVMGRTPDRVILVYFITARLRAFTVEFSAPPQWFDTYESIFVEMADSFSVLE